MYQAEGRILGLRESQDTLLSGHLFQSPSCALFTKFSPSRLSVASTMVFRDDNVVVIEMGSLLTRAVVGLAESMTPPQVRVNTRIGKKHNAGGSKAEYVFGEELDEAVAKNDSGVQVVYPVVQGRIADWEAVEIFWYAHKARCCGY